MTLYPCVALPALTDAAHRTVERAVEAVRASRPVLASSKTGMPLLAVDATAGNGHDTLFLAQTVGTEGLVVAFDIQPEALEATRLRLADEGLEQRVQLVLAGHEHMEKQLSERLFVSGSSSEQDAYWLHGQAAAVMFNLGFLPGSDKHTTTHPETTLPALNAATHLLAPHGLLSVHMYTGHPGGHEEGQAVLEWGESLSWTTWRCLVLSQHNKSRNREWLLLAERL